MRCPLSTLVVLVAVVLTPATSALAAPVSPSAGRGHQRAAPFHRPQTLAHHPATSAHPSPAPSHPSPAARPPSFGLRLVDVPLDRWADRRAWTYIIDFLHPGTEIRRRILVQNFGPSVAHVAVYPDAAVIKHGSFTGDAGETRTELITWVRMQRPELTLAPHAWAMDAVTIRVPPDASSGERYGVIWAQETTRVHSRGRIAVTEVNRVGVRIYLAVGPGGAPPTDFEIGKITGSRQKNGDPIIVARVRNTGGRAVDLSGHLRLFNGPGGISAGPFPIQYGTTLSPGQSGQVSSVLPNKQLPNGPWRVEVVLQSDLVQKRASATIDFAPKGISALLLWLGLAAILILIAAGIAFLVWRRLRRRNRPTETPTEDKVPI